MSFLRQRRTALRLSQVQLSEMVGVSQQTVARWETSGQIPAKHLKDLALVLKAPPQAFLPGTPDAARRSRLPASKSLQYYLGEDCDDAQLTFGDVRLRLKEDTFEEPRAYPISRAALLNLQAQLGAIGEFSTAPMPWLQFETLNNKWVAVNAEALEEVVFVDDDVEEMTSFEDPETYKAATELYDCLPSEKHLEEPDSPYSRPLVEQVAEFLKSIGDVDACAAELKGLRIEFTSGRRHQGRLNKAMADALQAAFDGEALRPDQFLLLSDPDRGTQRHVRLGALRLIEIPLAALDEMAADQ